jgi:hypothetical protein
MTWLNNRTDINTNFFAIQIELWRIDDSPCAPKFQIIVKPNNWAKLVKKVTNYDAILTETKLTQLEFWTQFIDYVQSKDLNIRLRKPWPRHWYNISFGFSQAHIELSINSQTEKASCFLYIPKNKDLFYYLQKYKNEIDEQFDYKLHWAELIGKKASKISIFTDAYLNKTDNWEDIYQWYVKNILLLQKIFSYYVKDYKK